MRKRIDYTDEINSLRDRVAQIANTLQQIQTEDCPRVERAFAELKTLSAEPAPVKRDGLNIIDPNLPDPGNPREEFALLRRKLELVSGELERSAKLLSDRQAAIAALLA
jgi:hypothetical protein